MLEDIKLEHVKDGEDFYAWVRENNLKGHLQTKEEAENVEVIVPVETPANKNTGEENADQTKAEPVDYPMHEALNLLKGIHTLGNTEAKP